MSFIKQLESKAELEALIAGQSALVVVEAYNKAFGPTTAINAHLYNVFCDNADKGKQLVMARGTQSACFPGKFGADDSFSHFIFYKGSTEVQTLHSHQPPVPTRARKRLCCPSDGAGGAHRSTENGRHKRQHRQVRRLAAPAAGPRRTAEADCCDRRPCTRAL